MEVRIDSIARKTSKRPQILCVLGNSGGVPAYHLILVYTWIILCSLA